MTPSSYSYTRYLTAKASVDERALNRQVWDALVATIGEQTDAGPIRVLEAGGGVGATFRRIVTALPRCDFDYTLLDIEESHLAYFKTGTLADLSEAGYEITILPEGGYRCVCSSHTVDIALIHADVNAYLGMEGIRGRYDLLVAQAFLDLFDLHVLLPALHAVLKPGGLCYYPINFDGLTAFLPVVDADQDRLYEHLYNRSMDDRQTDATGAPRSHTGRHLFTVLPKMGTNIVAAGSSDWLVYAGADRTYPLDEGYFLHHILHFFEQELTNHPGIQIRPFLNWLNTRRTQIEQGELIYMAHQLDILGKSGK